MIGKMMSFSTTELDKRLLYVPFDSMAEIYGDLIESSPSSSMGQSAAETGSLDGSNSTSTRTTPLRQSELSPPATVRVWEDYQSFCTALNGSDLPQRTQQTLDGLGRIFLYVGSTLFFSGQRAYIDSQNLVDLRCLCESVILSLSCSLQRINSQIQIIFYILSLAPFNVQPGLGDLCSNFKQRAELVISHVSLPSIDEYSILRHLLLIFDSYLYNPALVARRDIRYDPEMQLLLDGTYDTMMTLLADYKRWIQVVEHLRVRHMDPIMQRLVASDKALQETCEVHDLQERARAAVDDRRGPGLQPISNGISSFCREDPSAGLRKAEKMLALLGESKKLGIKGKR